MPGDSKAEVKLPPNSTIEEGSGKAGTDLWVHKENNRDVRDVVKEFGESSLLKSPGFSLI